MDEYTATKKGILKALMPPPQELKTGGLKTGALKSNKGMKDFVRRNHALKNDDGVVTLQVVIITSVIVLAAVLASILIINLLRDESKHIKVVLESERPPQLDPIAYSPTVTTEPSSELRNFTQGGQSINHSCIVTVNKTVQCWGENKYWQLGDGTQIDRGTPITVSGITGETPVTSAVQVSAGLHYTCAVLKDKTVKCWGGSVYENKIKKVEGLENVARVSAGGGHTCALLEDKTVQCWGSNQYGQLGDGTQIDRGTPITVSGITGETPVTSAVQVSAGTWHACAVLESGTVKCWGRNYGGQLGDGKGGTGGNNEEKSLIPLEVLEITGVGDANSAFRVSAGWLHTCAILLSGRVKCWGYNGQGQLGDGYTAEYELTPIFVSGIAGIDKTNSATEVFSGHSHTCAILEDKTVKCWGYNPWGQVGKMRTGRVNLFITTPFPISEITGENETNSATQIFLGGNHTCAVLEDKTVKCWGSNDDGQLGNEKTLSINTPVSISKINTATRVSAGGGHTCTLLKDKTVKCLGSNGAGQLGDGTTDRSFTPVFVLATKTPATKINNAVQVSAGGSHTCVLLEDKTVKCWGSNDKGQLGDGTGGSGDDKSLTPVSVLGITGMGDANSAVQISAGSSHTCAVLENGAVKCWGNNGSFYGQYEWAVDGRLGDGTTTNRLSPVLVLGITGMGDANSATQVSAAGAYTCALLENKTVKCWGMNSDGQLGDGSYYQRTLTPVLVSNIDNATQVSAAGRHTCALLEDKTVECWGNNYGGQLGDDKKSGQRSNTPISVLNIDNATQVSVAGAYTCVLLEDKTVKCWGNNISGQLGDETNYQKFLPVPVSYREINTANGALQISAGGEHACAVLEDGTMKCWGSNGSEQLGIELTGDSSTPVKVLLPSS